MPTNFNELNQPIGAPLPDWQALPTPTLTPLEGAHCHLEALNADKHTSELFEAYSRDTSGESWTYLGYGPFESSSQLHETIVQLTSGNDPLFYAIIDKVTGLAVGWASYMRIAAAMGVLEVGHIVYAPQLQRTTAATEVMYLLMKQAFELGYRRYEWKCDSLNEPSRKAALRLGFRFEGIFRQAIVYRGRNRDTAWYSIIDREWPALKQAFEGWLAAENFDAAGRQRKSLAAFQEQR